MQKEILEIIVSNSAPCNTHNTHSIKSTLSNNSGLRSFEGVLPHGTTLISLNYFQITLKASGNYHNVRQQIRKHLFKQIYCIGWEQWQLVAPELDLVQSAAQPSWGRWKALSMWKWPRRWSSLTYHSSPGWLFLPGRDRPQAVLMDHSLTSQRLTSGSIQVRGQ